MFTFIHTPFYSLSTVLCASLWLTWGKPNCSRTSKGRSLKEAEADKWKLLFSRSLVSEPDYSSDCEGGTCTRKETFWRNSAWNNKTNKLAVRKIKFLPTSREKLEVWLMWLSWQGEPRKWFVCWIDSLGFNICFVLVTS